MNPTIESPLRAVNKTASGVKKMTGTKRVWKKVFALALAGGLAFWLANFAISRTPIAAEYRSALSISYYPMLVESLLGGLIIGFCLSYFLFSFFDKIPTKNPISKSVILSLIALVIITVLIANPSSFQSTNDVLRYFLIGTIFNVLRIIAAGIVVGHLFDKL